MSSDENLLLFPHAPPPCRSVSTATRWSGRNAEFQHDEFLQGCRAGEEQMHPSEPLQNKWQMFETSEEDDPQPSSSACLLTLALSCHFLSFFGLQMTGFFPMLSSNIQVGLDCSLRNALNLAGGNLSVSFQYLYVIAFYVSYSFYNPCDIG